MSKALIITDSASTAFHTQQILEGLFSEVRACNQVHTAEQMLESFEPDLVVIFDLQRTGTKAPAVAEKIQVRARPTILVCPGLQSIAVSDPSRSVRISPPLTLTAVFKSMQTLLIDQIVDQSSLPIHLRRPAP